MKRDLPYWIKILPIGILSLGLLGVLFSVHISRVTSFSMEPTYSLGDRVLVESLSLRAVPPQRGEVIVFRDPRQATHPLVIKRIVGFPDERIDIKDDVVSVTDKKGVQTVFEKGSLLGREDNGKDFTMQLGPLDYFLMGDNRAGSKDSRTWGTIQLSEMFGRPLFHW